MSKNDILLNAFDYDQESGLCIDRKTGWVSDKPNRPDGYVMLYKTVNGVCNSMLVHRFAFLFMEGSIPDEVDHIDGNRLNNKWSNLRPVTRSQNNYNSKIRKDNPAGVKGVTIRKSGNYQVKVSINGKTKSFGAYKDLELAELIAQEVREKYHKEFTNHG